jgi:hypothetical protein
MSDDLDLLLSQPLEEPADAGFAALVLTRIGRMQAREAWLNIVATVLVAGLGIVLLLLTGAGRAVALSASQLAFSIPFAVGISLLFLSRLLLDAIPE